MVMKLSERKNHIAKNTVLAVLKDSSISMEARLEHLEAYMGTLPQTPIPLLEEFADGVYVREIMIPKGNYCIGRIHKYSHVSIMISGELLMWTEFDGFVHLKGYNRVVAPPGIKRFGYVLDDVKWITAHGTSDKMYPDNMVDSLTVSDYA